MSTFTEEQITLIQEYTQLLSSIQEGFEYITASYSDYSKTEGDVLLNDILQAFIQVIQANESLEVLFKDDAELESAISSFYEVTVAAEDLEGIFDQSQSKQEVVQQKLAPTYLAWYERVQPVLLEKIQQ